MVTKGIITSIDYNGNTCQVRIPFFETAGNDPISGTAIISNTPGSYNGYKVGDVVLVAFEDGQMNNPVIMGKLYLGAAKEKDDPRGAINVENIISSNSATLPADAVLTANVDKNVPNTTVPYASLSSIANGLNAATRDIGQLDRFVNNKFESVIDDANGLRTLIKQTANEILATALHKTDEGENGFGWILNTDGWKIYNTDSEHTYLKDIGIFSVDPSGVQITGTLKILDYPKINLVAYLSSNDADNKDITNTLEGSKKIPEEGESPIGWTIENPFTGRLEKYWGYTVDSITNSISINTAHSTPDYSYNYVWKLACDISYDAETVIISGKEHKRLKEVVKNITYECLKSESSYSGPNSRFRPVTDIAYEIAQGKSTNYYLQVEPYRANTISELPDFDPESEDDYEDYGEYFTAPRLKVGDCWFKLDGTNPELAGNPAKGILRQCVAINEDEESDEYGKATWEDIGGEIVANKITANYINALKIIAKKITVYKDGDDTQPILFSANGLPGEIDSNTVKIADFDVGNNTVTAGGHTTGGAYLKANTIGDSGSVLVSPGYTTTISTLNSHEFTWAFAAGGKFGVTVDGDLFANSVRITGDDSVEVHGNLYNYSSSSDGMGHTSHTADKLSSVTKLRGTGLYITNDEYSGNWGMTYGSYNPPAHIPPIDPDDFQLATWDDNARLSENFWINSRGLYSTTHLYDFGSTAATAAVTSAFPLIIGYSNKLYYYHTVDHWTPSGDDHWSYTITYFGRDAVSGLSIRHGSATSLDEHGIRKLYIDSTTKLVETTAASYNPDGGSSSGGPCVSLHYAASGSNSDGSYNVQNTTSELTISNTGVGTAATISILSEGSLYVGWPVYGTNINNNAKNLKLQGSFIGYYYAYYPFKEHNYNAFGWKDTVYANHTLHAGKGWGGVDKFIGTISISAYSFVDVPRTSGSFPIQSSHQIIGATANIVVPEWHAGDTYNYGRAVYVDGYKYNREKVTAENYTGYTYYYENGYSGHDFLFDSSNTFDSNKKYWTREEWNPKQPVIHINSSHRTGSYADPCRIYNPNGFSIVVTYVIYFANKLTNWTPPSSN